MTADLSTPRPDISVIVPVYNAALTIERCILSIVKQSLGPGRTEIITVDDGSDDSTPQQLAALAQRYPQLRLIRTARTGRPADPRNVGLEHARGRFVFFVDADDWLGPEALERLLHMADRNSTDIVLGKIVGVGGRRAATSMFAANADVTDIFSSHVYRNLVIFKLFRRSFLQQLGLRFDEHAEYGEDIVFAAQAFLHTQRVSVVADYDCYYWTLTPGMNLSRRYGSHARVHSALTAMGNLATAVPPGAQRDQLMARHLGDVVGFLKRWAKEGEHAHESDFTTMREAVLQYTTDDTLAVLLPEQRLPLWLLLMGRGDLVRQVFVSGLPTSEETDKVHDGSRVYAVLPFFRDPSVGVPDKTYDLTGMVPATTNTVSVWRTGSRLALTGWFSAPKTNVDPAALRLTLRSRSSGSQLECPLTPVSRPAPDTLGWRAELDLLRMDNGSPLPPGVWDFQVEDVFGTTVAARLHASTFADGRGLPPRLEQRVPGGTYFDGELYVTRRSQKLSLDIGRSRDLGNHAVLAEVSWQAHGAVSLELGGWPARDSSLPTQAQVLLRHRTDLHEVALPGRIRPYPALLEPPAARRAQSPAGGAPQPAAETLPAPPVPRHAVGHIAELLPTVALQPGVWDAYLRFQRGQHITDVRVRAATFIDPQDLQPPRKARSTGARPYITKLGNLSFKVETTARTHRARRSK